MSHIITEMTPEKFQSMMDEEKRDRETYALTEDDLEPLKAWVAHGILPGGFLQAVLRNDLVEATGRADLHNRRRLFEYVGWLYNEAPADCWRSQRNMDAWQEACAKERSDD